MSTGSWAYLDKHINKLPPAPPTVGRQQDHERDRGAAGSSPSVLIASNTPYVLPAAVFHGKFSSVNFG